MAQALEALSNALSGIGQQYYAKTEKDQTRQEHLDDVAAERAWMEGRDKQQFSNQEQLLKDQSAAEAERQQKQLEQHYEIELKLAKAKPLVELQAEADVLGLPTDMPAKDLQAAVANAHAKIAADADMVKNAPNAKGATELYTQARTDFDNAVKTSAKLEAASPADIVRQAKAVQLSGIIDQVKPAGMSREAYLKKIGTTEEQIRNNPEAVANNPKLTSNQSVAVALMPIAMNSPDDLKNAELELKRQQSAAQQRAMFAHQAMLEYGKEGIRYGASGMVGVAPVTTTKEDTTPDTKTKPKSILDTTSSAAANVPDNPIDAEADRAKAANEWWNPRQQLVASAADAAKFLEASKSATRSAKSFTPSGAGLGFGFSTGAGAPIQTPGYEIPGYGFLRPEEAQSRLASARQIIAEAPNKIKQLDAGVPTQWQDYFSPRAPVAVTPIAQPNYYWNEGVDSQQPPM